MSNYVKDKNHAVRVVFVVKFRIRQASLKVFNRISPYFVSVIMFLLKSLSCYPGVYWYIFPTTLSNAGGDNPEMD